MTSISGSASLNIKVDLGGTMNKLAKATQKTVSDLEKLGTVQVDGPGKRYLDERGQRADGVMNKLARGEVINAALDVFQAFSPGGRISDGAKALGLVHSDAEKYMLSGVCNALLLGPLAPATLADGEDFLKTQLPHLQKTSKGFEQLGARPHRPDVHAAPPHFAPSPRARMSAHFKVSGYARGQVGAKFNLEASLRRPAFQARLGLYGQAGVSANIVLGGFARSLPALTSYYSGGVPAKGGASKAQGPSKPEAAKADAKTDAKTEDKPQVSDSSIAKFLSDPTLSFEDKMFLFLLAMAQRQEKKMEAMMADYDKAKNDKNSEVSKARGDRDKKAGGGEAAAGGQAAGNPLSALVGGGGSASSPKVVQGQDGQPRPTGGKNNSTLGGIVDVTKGVGAPAVRMLGQAAPMAAPALGSLLGGILGSAIPIPVVGTALGAMIGGMLGDMIAKEMIPQACDQIANGLENGDYDQLLKFGTVYAANSVVPGLGMALQAQDAGLESVFQPFSYLNPAVQSKSSQGAQAADPSAPAEAEDMAATGGAAPAKGGKSAKASKAAKAGATAAAGTAEAGAADKAEGDSGVEGDPNKRSDQEWMMRLQKAQEELSKMYTMVSNMLKAFNDTQMTAVRNLR
ncbi:MAG: glycine zipper domain-containing protein [Pseudomonadota bacterium]